MQIEEFRNSWSRASDDFEKRRALISLPYIIWPTSYTTLRISPLFQFVATFFLIMVHFTNNLDLKMTDQR